MYNIITNKIVQFVGVILCCYISYYFKNKQYTSEYVFDDLVALVRNPDVTNLSSNWQNVFRNDFWGMDLLHSTSHKSYRPLTILTYRVENALFGMNPYYMKITNLILHCLLTCLIIPLSNTIFGRKSVTAIATILFSIHPIHTEAVSSIVGRADILAALFFVITIFLYMKFIKSEFKENIPFTIIFCAFLGICALTSVLCKETGVTVLFVCATIDIIKNLKFHTNVKILKMNRLLIIRLLILFISTILIIYLRLRIMNFKNPTFKPMDNPIQSAESFFTRFLTQNYLYCLNFYLLICPDWLCFDWALGSIKLIDSYYDYRIVFVILLYSFIYFVRYAKRNVLIGLALMCLPFLPASGIIKIGFVIAERILYIPSIGYCFIVALGLEELKKKYSYKKIIYAAFSVIVITFILKTRMRALEWTNMQLLYTSGVRVCPNNAKIHYNIAKIYTDSNREIAFTFYHKAIQLFPQYESALMNLGNLYREIHDYDNAEKYLRRSIEVLPDFPAAWMNLAIVQATTKNFKESVKSYETALSLKKNYPNCYYNLGNLYNEMKNTSMALKNWYTAVSYNPRHSQAWSNILANYDYRGLTEEILKTSALALKHLPDSPAILFSRANAFGKINEFEKAEKLYLKIIELNPKKAVYHANLGVLYHRWKKTDLAVQLYKHAIVLDPSIKSAQQNLKSLLKRDININKT